MADRFSAFLARRYLRPKSTFVLVINIISMVGVILGVWALIVVLAVMKGFELLQKDLMLGIQSHLLITQESPGGAGVASYDEVLERVRATPGVTAASPYVEGKAGFSRESFGESSPRLNATIIRGLEEDDPLLQEIMRPRKFRAKENSSLLLAGEVSLKKFVREDGNDLERVIVSRPLSLEPFNLRVGTEFQLHSLLQVDQFLGSLQEKRAENPLLRDIEVEELRTSDSCIVSAVIDMPLTEPFVMFVPLHIAQEAYSLEGNVHGIGAQVNDPYDLDAAKNAVAAALPSGWKVRSWLDDNFLRLRAIRTERALTSTLFFFIIIVAAFCIMNTVIVTTVQKRREIGTLKAIGARDGQIISVFLAQSAVVGLAGTIIGVVIALLTVQFIDPLRHLLASLGSDPFPVTLFDLQRVPTDLRAADVLWITLASIVACTLAAWLPAWAASRQDAAKALRNE